jgi:HlyD family secretion protein
MRDTVIRAAGSMLLLAPLLGCAPQGPTTLVAAAEAAEASAGAQAAGAVAALGYLEPQGEVIDVATSLAEPIHRLLVEEGDEVDAAAELAYLQSHPEREAELELARQRLAEAEGRLAAETAYGEALIREAELTVEVLEQVQPLEIEALEARVDALSAQLENAERDLQRLRGLTANNAVAQQQFDHQETETRRVDADLRGARAELARGQAALPADLSSARARLDAARADLLRVVPSLQVGSLRREVALAEARLERTIIRAPTAGRILKVHARAGEAAAGGTILEMGDTANMYVLAEVYETDIGRVRVGQRATASSRALPAPLTGTVERLGSIVTRNRVFDIDPGADVDRRVLEVRIRLDDRATAARLVNLQVAVEIEVDG